MKYLKVYENSSNKKITDDFIDLIDYLCLDFRDNNYTVDIYKDLYSLLSGSRKAFNTLKSTSFITGEGLIVETLKIVVKAKGGTFDTKIVESIEDIAKLASKFDFNIDLNLDDDYLSLDDLYEYFLPLSDFNTLTIIVY